MTNFTFYNGNSSNKTVVLVIATISAFLTPFMSSALNVALPAIAKEFSLDAVLLSWVATSFILSAAIFMVPLGRIADIYGRKKIFLYGIILYGIASFLPVIIKSAFLLLLSRVLQGIGGAMIFGTSVAILTSVYPIGERGKALGINVSAVYLGLSLGPILGGILTQHFGWRSIFLINIPLSIIVIILVLEKLKPEWAEAQEERFDFIGSLIYGLALLLIMFGFSLLPKLLGLGLVILGILAIFLFIQIEVKTRSPILNISLFRNNPVFTFSNLAAAINYSATAAVGFLLSLYLQHIKGLSSQNAGLILVSQPIMMTIFSPVAGKLSDQIEPRIVASIGMAITFLGLVLFILLRETTGIGFVVFNLVLLGLGFALFSSPNTNAIMSAVEKRFYGVASGMLGTMRLIGQMFSMGIVMLLFAVIIGRVQITAQYYLPLLKSIKITFMIFAILCFGGIFASLARGKLR
ncbi:MAG: MFS transporter [candidate division WOR-3 bacterium]